METQTADQFVQDTTVRRIKSEVLALMEQQTNAICSAAFVGMTEIESRRSEERCKKIAALVEQLMRIEESRHNEPRPGELL